MADVSWPTLMAQAVHEARIEGARLALDAAAGLIQTSIDDAGDHPTAQAMRRIFADRAAAIRALDPAQIVGGGE
jgi:hypothetical protein